MKTSEDLRIIKTKRNIERTFLSLLRTTPLEKITVRQILMGALINRGTFYHHYMDKYDLADQIAKKEIKKGERRLKSCLDAVKTTESNKADPWWMKIEPFTPDEIDMWYLLSKLPVGDSTFETEYKRMVYDQFFKHIKKQGQADADASRQALAAVQLYMGYFPFYTQSGNCPAFADYIQSIQIMLN